MRPLFVAGSLAPWLLAALATGVLVTFLRAPEEGLALAFAVTVVGLGARAAATTAQVARPHSARWGRIVVGARLAGTARALPRPGTPGRRRDLRRRDCGDFPAPQRHARSATASDRGARRRPPPDVSPK